MKYTEINIKVVENGYEVEYPVSDDHEYCVMAYVFTTREELYRFLDPLLEIGTEKAGDDEEWNHQ